MRVGYVLPNSWGMNDPNLVNELAVLAEQAGATSLWVSHHLLHTGFVKERLDTGPYYDPLITLAVAATVTERVVLGTSVLVLPYLEPFATAKALATIDWLSRGRVAVGVGVGVGGLRPEHDVVSRVPWADRGRYADEFIDVMAALWRPGASTFHGEFFHVDDVEAYPGPFHPGGLPVLVGGHGPAALRRAARRAQGWHGLGLSPDEAGAERETLAHHLQDAGRSLEGFPFQLRLHIPVDDLGVDGWRAKAQQYAEAGVDELVLAPQSGDLTAHRRWLEVVLAALTAA